MASVGVVVGVVVAIKRILQRIAFKRVHQQVILADSRSGRDVPGDSTLDRILRRHPNRHGEGISGGVEEGTPGGQFGAQYDHILGRVDLGRLEDDVDAVGDGIRTRVDTRLATVGVQER